jgi:hypothetical protein
MSKAQTPPRIDKEQAARVKLEATALRSVFQLAPEDRAENARRLDAIALCLVNTCQAVADALQDAPAIELADILSRPALRDECATVKACEAWGVLSGEEPLDPDEGKKAFARALEDTQRVADLRRAKEIERLAGRLENAKTATERRDILRDIEDRAGTARGDLELPLAQLWQEHLDKIDTKQNGQTEALFLDVERRGGWAQWFNNFLSPRGGLTPGRTMLIGGGPGGGKTSLAGALATDSLWAGVPVTFYQLELGVEETLEHIAAQDPTRIFKARPHYASRFLERVVAPWPAPWEGLLSVPRRPGYRTEDALDALRALARKADKMRRAGRLKHDCAGLFILDYVQLLKMADKGGYHARHDEMTDAISWLAKEAAESGACLVLLSQVTKASRREGDPADGTEYAGADIARAAHVALTISPGHWNEEKQEVEAATSSKPCEPIEDKGTPRYLAFTKERGVWMEEGAPFPAKRRGLWYLNRALYGGPGDDHAEQKTMAGIVTTPAPYRPKPKPAPAMASRITTPEQDEAAEARSVTPGPEPF